MPLTHIAMTIDKYVIEGHYEFNEAPVFLDGNIKMHTPINHVNIDPPKYLSAQVIECLYKFSGSNFWGVIQKVDKIKKLLLVENPIKLDLQDNIVFYLEEDFPPKNLEEGFLNVDYEGTYTGQRFNNIKILIPPDIEKMGERRIIRYVLTEMEFYFDDSGLPAYLELRKKSKEPGVDKYLKPIHNK